MIWKKGKIWHIHKRAYWWRLYYWFFTDQFKGLSLKEVLEEYYVKD